MPGVPQHHLVWSPTMEEGARRRGGSEKATDGPDQPAEGGVGLKKEIGLVSACGIIIGEWRGVWRRDPNSGPEGHWGPPSCSVSFSPSISPSLFPPFLPPSPPAPSLAGSINSLELPVTSWSCYSDPISAASLPLSPSHSEGAPPQSQPPLSAGQGVPV